MKTVDILSEQTCMSMRSDNWIEVDTEAAWHQGACARRTAYALVFRKWRVTISPIGGLKGCVSKETRRMAE
jgi:hypothetical protein